MNSGIAGVQELAQRWQAEGDVRTVAERVDQQAVDAFATVIRDVDPTHNDPDWAATSPFGGTIVQGVHMLALVPAQVHNAGLPTRPTVDYAVTLRRLERARFVAPLAVGTETRTDLTVTKVKESSGGGLNVQVTVELKDAGTDATYFVGDLIFAYEIPGGPSEAVATSPKAEPKWRAGAPLRLPRYHDFHSFFGQLRAGAGKSMGATDWYRVDDLAMGCFGAVTKDFRLDHVPYQDASPPHGPPRVYPIHHLALSLGMARDVGLPLVTDSYQTVLNYGFNNVEWSTGAEVGKWLRTHVSLGDVEERRGGYLLSIVHAVEVEERDEPCMVGTNLALWLPLDELEPARKSDGGDQGHQDIDGPPA